MGEWHSKRDCEHYWAYHAVEAELEQARQLLRACHEAIRKAIVSEDGLDGGEGGLLLVQIERALEEPERR